MTNLLEDTEGVLTFDQYTISDFWTATVDADGAPVLQATVETLLDIPYELEFSTAANLAAGAVDVEIEVWFADSLVGSFTQSGALFEDQTLTVTGTGGSDQLEFRIVAQSAGSDTQGYDTSGVIPSYEATMSFLGEEVTVDAFMPGQGLVYQVLGGQLVMFDLSTQTYTETEYENDFRVNAMGYSTEHDLIFGHARQSGVDSQGQEVSAGDIVAFDATGATYKVAETPYSHYIGDIDGDGYLWTFSAGLDIAVRYDLNTIDADGQPAMLVFELPDTVRSTAGLADLAYDPGTQTFYGVAHGGQAGSEGTLFAVDVSELVLGGEAQITETAITGTLVDGTVQAGIPSSAYGAAMVDADGTVYVGANSADHDLDASTATSGGFYQLVNDDSGDLVMELLADAPRVSSNDGAMDTRGHDPFLGIDTSSTVLLKEPNLSIAIAEDDSVTLAAKGAPVIVDLLANDTVSEGETLTVTQIDGQAVEAGLTLTLSDGAQVLVQEDGTLLVTPAWTDADTVAQVTYTIVNDRGVSDSATVTVTTSPVQGGAGADQMLLAHVDADGTAIDGTDGADDVILGHGGDDKIFAGTGDDDVFGGAGDDFIRAGEGADVVEGGAGADVVDGGAGGDVLRGGDGDDIYYLDDQGDRIEEETAGHDLVKTAFDHRLAEALEDLWLLEDTAALRGEGNAKANDIKGNAAANALYGHDGDDSIEGYDGDDLIEGGAGHDTLHGDAGDDRILGDAGDDKLHGGAGADSLLGGDGADTLDGGDGDDLLEGGAGDDLLSGGAGADRLSGGAGDDAYKVADAGDVVIEAANGGDDTVTASVDFTLADHLETLRLTGGARLGTGNDADNALYGSDGDNVLDGRGGQDRIDGGAGNDTLWGGDDADSLTGGTGDDWLHGGAGNDKLDTGAGTDTCIGGTGNDRMKAGSGADTFVFAVGDGDDTVYKFDAAEDVLCFEGLDASGLSVSEGRKGAVLSYGDGDSIYLVGIATETVEDLTFVYV